MGVSRDTFYRYQGLVADGGIDNLIDKSRRKPNTKNRVDDVTEKAVIEYAMNNRHMANIGPVMNCVRSVCLSQVAAFVQSGFVITWKTLETFKSPRRKGCQ
jgi:hypothetical protein